MIPRSFITPAQFLYRSTDRGDSWTRISPDLTTGVDQNSLPIMGRLPDEKMLSRHDGIWNWPCITAISESPAQRQTSSGSGRTTETCR